MIRYTLRCSQGHEFEGWFASSSAFDKQEAAKLIECAVCGSGQVEKALMAPNVMTSRKKAKARAEVMTEAMAQSPGAAATSPAPAVAAGMPPGMREMIQRIREHVKAHSEDVGPRFAEEARKIHYEETEARSIHGEASGAEVAELLDEGIDVMPLPPLADDHH